MSGELTNSSSERHSSDIPDRSFSSRVSEVALVLCVLCEPLAPSVEDPSDTSDTVEVFDTLESLRPVISSSKSSSLPNDELSELDLLLLSPLFCLAFCSKER